MYWNAIELSMRVLIRVSGLSTILPVLLVHHCVIVERKVRVTYLRTSTPIAKFCKWVGEVALPWPVEMLLELY